MFRYFEREAIRALVGGKLGRDVVERVLSATEVEVDWTGAGYFLTVADDDLPTERSVFSTPLIVGTGGGVDVGFVVFVENAQLTLECHGFDDRFPDDLRDVEVSLSVDGRPLRPRTREDFEKLTETLIGSAIRTVRYYEVDYGEDAPMWDKQSPHFDSLDFGVELGMDDGSTVAVTWGTEFVQYGLSLSWEPLGRPNEPGQFDGTHRWNHVIDQEITGTKVYWSWVEESGTRTHYPQDLELTFANGEKVTLSVFEHRSDTGFEMGMMDNITVFFRDEDLKRFRIGVDSPD